LSARQEDISEPLLAISDACGGHWPELMRQAVLHFCGKAKTEEGDSKRELLKDIQEGFGQQQPPDRFGSAAIRDYLNSLEHRQWRDWNDGRGISQRQIADRLRDYQVTPRNIKLAEGKVVKGYYLADFQEAFDRYLSQEGLSNRYSATEPVNIDEKPLFPSATVENGSGAENMKTPNKIRSGSGVADEELEISPKEAQEALL
jgi:hypothetical protein